jgi:serine O-acetyltransferase
VIVGAGAQLLGPISVGAGARVGSNAVVIADVAPNTTVVGVPARPVDEKLAISDEKSKAFEPYGTHDTRADPTLAVLQQMAEIIQGLKARVEELESRQAGIEKTAGKWEG